MTGTTVFTHHFYDGFYGWRFAAGCVRRRMPAACHCGEKRQHTEYSAGPDHRLIVFDYEQLDVLMPG